MTAIQQAKLEWTITSVFGDFNDERRNAAHLRDYLTIGQDVRINRGNRSNWQKAKITKIGKKSFEVGENNPITFTVTKYGHIYERGTANEVWGHHWKVDFNVEAVDKMQAAKDISRKNSGDAIDLSRSIQKKLDYITPRDLSWGVSDTDLAMLKKLAEILELPTA